MANKSFGALARLRKCHELIHRETKFMLVKTLVFPHLKYCSGLLLSLTEDLWRRLERCKNAALRFGSGDHADVYKFRNIAVYFA